MLLFSLFHFCQLLFLHSWTKRFSQKETLLFKKCKCNDVNSVHFINFRVVLYGKWTTSVAFHFCKWAFALLNFFKWFSWHCPFTDCPNLHQLFEKLSSFDNGLHFSRLNKTWQKIASNSEKEPTTLRDLERML